MAETSWILAILEPMDAPWKGLFGCANMLVQLCVLHAGQPWIWIWQHCPTFGTTGPYAGARARDTMKPTTKVRGGDCMLAPARRRRPGNAF